jgi:beta-lactamase class D
MLKFVNPKPHSNQSMKQLLVLLFLQLTFLCYGHKNNEYSAIDLDTVFKENTGTFVLYDLRNNKFQVYNSDRAKMEFAVHSTSKIFWSIIGLEEKLINSENDLIRWDSIKYPYQDWWPVGWDKDQNIITALNKSVNWYYFELLTLMTPEVIEKYMNKLDYKKGFEIEKVQYFGLTYLIKMSAFEQIDFLKRFYSDDFKMSEKNKALIKLGLLYQKTDQYTIYAKTGLGPIENDNTIGWFIGYVEKDNNVYFFALNVEDPDELKVGKLRKDLSMRILKLLGVI